MHVHCSRPVLGLSTVRSPTFLTLVAEYEQRLVRTGYHPIVARLHLHAIAHFGIWLEREHHQLTTIVEDTLRAFDQHRATCTCRGASRNRAREVLSAVRRFLQHLRERGVVEPAVARPQPVPVVAGFLRWMQVDRGVGESTLTSYGNSVGDLVRLLGNDPRTYTARGLRDFAEQRCRYYRRGSARMLYAAVRMFLRYLAVEGQCRPGLEHALTPLASWSHQALPRGLTPTEVRRVLAACPSTPRGLRDRAVLLLMLRLGLRAGDVAAVRRSDLCFDTAVIHVSGKGAREVRLPLPQDVGDALLAYLRAGRPPVPTEVVFLRTMAPFTPFAPPRPGKGIEHIARSALKRAGVRPPTTGAHVFRHTAACEMLRHGVGLEGIAAVLHHRSVETTGIYAKVDRALLAQVAQPWPEVVPC